MTASQSARPRATVTEWRTTLGRRFQCLSHQWSRTTRSSLLQLRGSLPRRLRRLLLRAVRVQKMTRFTPTRDELYLNTRMNIRYHHMMARRAATLDTSVKALVAVLSAAGSAPLVSGVSKWIGLSSVVAAVAGAVSSARSFAKNIEDHASLAERYAEVLTQIRTEQDNSPGADLRLFALFDAVERLEARVERGRNGKVLTRAQEEIRKEEVRLLASKAHSSSATVELPSPHGDERDVSGMRGAASARG